MTAEDFIIELFCWVDDLMSHVPEHPHAKLYPSEAVTIGLLFALKGGYFRTLYRWLSRDCAGLFAGLPKRTRLQQLLLTLQGWRDGFLATPTFFTVIDSHGIDLLHPIREGRRPHQIGKNGKSNWRRIIRMKLCWLFMTMAKFSCRWQSRSGTRALFWPILDSTMTSDPRQPQSVPARYLEWAQPGRNCPLAGDRGLSFEQRLSSYPTSLSSSSCLRRRSVQHHPGPKLPPCAVC